MISSAVTEETAGILVEPVQGEGGRILMKRVRPQGGDKQAAAEWAAAAGIAAGSKLGN